MKRVPSTAVAAFLIATVLAAVPPAATAQSTDSQIKAEVQRQLARVDSGLARLDLEVQSGVVRVSGDIATLWFKEEAVKRLLKVEGVTSVEAQLTIPSAESDAALAREVADRIRHYDLYTVYDTIDGRVQHGAVRLDGAVTEPKKAADIHERVAKVKGVQAIDDRLVVLPASRADDRLRVTIANGIYRDEAFLNYSMVDPPVHVIVNNGHVTLIGYVRSDIERIKAESVARSVNGVLALDNKIQVVGPSARK